MGSIECMVGFHHSLHEVDEIPENLTSSHTVEVRWTAQMMFHRKDQVFGQCLKVSGCVLFVGGHATEIVPAYFTAPLQNHLQICLIPVVPLEKIGHRRAPCNRSMPVAKLPIIIALKHRIGVMVHNGKCVDNGIRCLNFAPQELVKPIRVYTGSCR